MSNVPRLAIHERLAAMPLRWFIFYKLSKIRTHEVVARSDIKLPEKKVYSPRAILYVKDPENGFFSTVLLFGDQKGLVWKDRHEEALHTLE